MASGELGNLLVRISADVTGLKKQLADAQKQVQNNTKKFNTENGKSQKGFAATAKAIKAQWMAITASIMAAMVAVRMFAATVTEFADFEQGLTNVKVLLGDSKGDIILFSREVEKLALTFGITTKKLLKSSFDIQSAVGDVSKSINILNASTRLSVAGASDMEATTAGLLTLMESYGDKLEGAADASDLLFIAQVRARATIAELTESSSDFLPLAAQLSIGVEDLFAVYAKMTKALGNANESATAMTGVLNGLIKPTEELKAKSKEWYDTSIQQALRQGKFLDILERLGQVTEEEIGRMLPRIKGLKGLLAVSKDINKVKEFSIEFTEREGVVTEALADQMDTTARKLAKLAEETKKLKRDFGELLANLGIVTLLSGLVKTVKLLGDSIWLLLHPIEEVKLLWQASLASVNATVKGYEKLKGLIEDIQRGTSGGLSPEEAEYNRQLMEGEQAEAGMMGPEGEPANAPEEDQDFSSLFQENLEAANLAMDSFMSNFNKIKSSIEALSVQSAKLITGQITMLSKGIGNAFAEMIFNGKDFGKMMMDVFKQMGMSFVAQVTEMIVQWVLFQAIGKALQAAQVGAATGFAAMLTAIWTVPAALASIATQGAAVAIGNTALATGLVSAKAMSAGMQAVPSGRDGMMMTGNMGEGGIPAIMHPNEIVAPLDKFFEAIDSAQANGNISITVNGNVDDPQELAELIAEETDRRRRGG